MESGDPQDNKQVYETEDIVEQYAGEDRISMGLFSHEELAVREYFGDEGRVLDIGIGGGRTTRALEEDLGLDTVGVDIAANQIVRAREYFPEYSLGVADASSLPFDRNAFEYVLFSNNGLDLVYPESSRFDTLAEIRRVLKPDGVFVFSAHNTTPVRGGVPPWSGFGLRTFVDQVLRGEPPAYTDTGPSEHTYYIDSRSQTEQLRDHGFETLAYSVRVPVLRRNAFLTRSAALAHLDVWPYYVATPVDR